MATNNYLFKNSSDLKEIVDLSDYLKTMFKEDGSIEFPNIVIVGDQSSGKTSLIENTILYYLKFILLNYLYI